MSCFDLIGQIGFLFTAGGEREGKQDTGKVWETEGGRGHSPKFVIDNFYKINIMQQSQMYPFCVFSQIPDQRKLKVLYRKCF